MKMDSKENMMRTVDYMPPKKEKKTALPKMKWEKEVRETKRPKDVPYTKRRGVFDWFHLHTSKLKQDPVGYKMCDIYYKHIEKCYGVPKKQASEWILEAKWRIKKERFDFKKSRDYALLHLKSENPGLDPRNYLFDEKCFESIFY